MTQNEGYHQYVGTVIGDLYLEVLIIGVITVGVNYFRGVFLAEKPGIGGGGFSKRLILFFSVLLLVVYYSISYHIDVSGTVVTVTHLTRGHGFIPSWVSILIIAPLDLLIIGVSGMLFIVLSLEFIWGSRKEVERCGLPRQIFALFLLTAIWHYGAVLWWISWFGSKGTEYFINQKVIGDFFNDLLGYLVGTTAQVDKNKVEAFFDEFNSVMFHVGIATSNLICGFIFRSFFHDIKFRERTTTLEWIGVTAFASIALFVYIQRFGAVYIQDLVLAQKCTSAHSMWELVLVPATTLILVNSLLTWRLLVYKWGKKYFWYKLSLLWLVPIVGHIQVWSISKRKEEPKTTVVK